MPYIPQDEREALQEFVEDAHVFIETPGQLVYFITKIALQWLPDNPSWEERCRVHQFLVAAEREFQRRVIDPYEDRKAAENGDVYP